MLEIDAAANDLDLVRVRPPADALQLRLGEVADAHHQVGMGHLLGELGSILDDELGPAVDRHAPGPVPAVEGPPDLRRVPQRWWPVPARSGRGPT